MWHWRSNGVKYIDEYRNKEIIHNLLEKIRKIFLTYPGKITLMEVCGTHTMNIFRSGIGKLLPQSLRLLSGPGCPVCVTPNHYLDKAIAYAGRDDVIIITFGDMMRVPGSSSSTGPSLSTNGLSQSRQCNATLPSQRILRATIRGDTYSSAHSVLGSFRMASFASFGASRVPSPS